jgi:site-specific recombinase XerD
MKGNAIERCWKRFMVGDRVSELVGLKKYQICFDEGFIKITGKGNKQRSNRFSSKIHSALL